MNWGFSDCKQTKYLQIKGKPNILKFILSCHVPLAPTFEADEGASVRVKGNFACTKALLQ